MTLRTKLLLAQLPLVAALLSTSVVGGLVAGELAQSSRRILKDNYRSVLAMQRLQESVERSDSAVLFAVAGQRQRGVEQVEANRQPFADELRVQQGNLTEPGEGEATAELQQAWSAYSQAVETFLANPDAAVPPRQYFDRVLPAFLAVKNAAAVILNMNQEAMVQKSVRAEQLARRSNTLLIAVSLAGLLIGLLASSALTSRLLRPLSILGQTARRLGEGDVGVRALIAGEDEIARLAGEVNTMAERIQHYRESSLGELLEAHRAAQATIDSLPDPVLVQSLEGELLQVNHAAEGVLKARLEGGAKGTATLAPAIREVLERVRHHVASGRGPYVPRGLDEAIGLATAEGERHYLPRATPLYAEEGAVVGTTVVFQDVTRLLRFEELRNNVVATVAHEFRTPLTSLRMAIHLLTEPPLGPLTGKQGDLVYAAREDCDRLQSIVDELLDLSRIQAGRIELRQSPADAEALVRTALEAQRSAAGQRQVQLRSEVLPGTAPVFVDPDRIQLVLANLLSNAIKHSPAGGAVSVRTSAANGWMRFEVADTGPGIPKELQQAIFEKYYRVPGAPAGGAGLGLFIARELVHAHQGEIGVESAPGSGSKFWFKVRTAETEI